MTTVRRVHVDVVTGEERAPRGADLFMEVERKDDGFEYVLMQNVQMHDTWETIYQVKPKGKGWERWDTRSDKRTTWRRKV